MGVRIAGLAIIGLLAVGPARADDDDPASDLTSLSIDELSALNVTSVSKQPEPIVYAASSIYGLTADAIRRSGASSLPELLRLAPNLGVTRIDALDYSITARGFGGFEAANKLLVLVDGRSVYTPLFSGVNWDQHHVLIEDLSQVEVISGPGGVLWGANAVNGVVNITTRSAFDTRGVLAAANVGTLDSDVRFRVGGALGEDLAARIYVTAFRRGDLTRVGAAETNDGWDGRQGGFRADWAGDRATVTLQGDIQDAAIPNTAGPAGYVRGGNLLGRWSLRGANGAFEVQAYYDQIEREARLIHDELKVWDIQAQHALSLGDRHRLIWGAGYRFSRDEFRTLTEPQLLAPPRRRTVISNIFLQDEVTLTPALMLTVGAKLEDNSYTRAEWLPSARLGWRLSERQFLWGAVSRAIRNPSRIERDFTIPGLVTPGRMGSETLVAYELGYRGRVAQAASLSVSLFYNVYDRLRTNDLTAPGVLPIFVGNTMRGETYGIEAWLDYQVRPWWLLSAGGVVIGKDFRLKPGSLDLAQFEAAGVDPDYVLKARSEFRLADNLGLGFGLRAYGATPPSRADGYVGAPAYVEASARLAWQVNEAVELSVSGENLLHARHLEASEARHNAIPRSVQIGLRWAP